MNQIDYKKNFLLTSSEVESFFNNKISLTNLNQWAKKISFSLMEYTYGNKMI